MVHFKGYLDAIITRLTRPINEQVSQSSSKCSAILLVYFILHQIRAIA